MKVLLTTLNSKFIHSSLSIRYLKEYVRDLIDIEIEEYTINQSIDYITSDIYKKNPAVIGFSTYIWNLTETLQICEILKIVNPNIKIFLGGPEVSFDGKNLLEEKEYIDFVIYGEGEETFREFIEGILNGKEDFNQIRGLIYREGNEIIENGARPLIRDLNKIPSPYENLGNEFENKIVYYESSRGCPFGCKFCLSSTIQGVRYFSIDRVKNDLENLINGKVRQVKFVDRTFNANKQYAMEIMNFIMDKDPKNMNFHFEVTAHLLDDEMMEFLSRVKEGLFQFEVGVQSTNDRTIEAVGRTTDFPKLRQITKTIKSYKRIHQHLDLIVGLPYEGYGSFRKSFNDVYEIRPEKIQLGFLKLLKGSDLRIEEKKYGFKYLDIPPYEIIENNYISYKEIIKLKAIEDLVERYYNEGYFEKSIEYIVTNHYETPFDFYEDFSTYWEEEGYHRVSNSRNKLYEIILRFYKYKEFKSFILFNELIKYDFIKNNKNGNLPKGINRVANNIRQSEIHDILKDKRILEEYLPEYMDIPTKRLIRKVAIERFSQDVLTSIEKGYNSNGTDQEVDILFIYRDGVINRCETYDISKITGELI